MEIITMGPDVSDGSQKLFEVTQNITMAGTMAMKGDKAKALVLAISAAAGALQVAALLLQDNSAFTEDDVGRADLNGLTSKDAMVTAALLSARCIQFAENTVSLDYGPDRIYRATQAAGTVLGHEVSGLNPEMMNAAKACYDTTDTSFFGGELITDKKKRTLN